MADTLERLARGAFFAQKGAIFAFSNETEWTNRWGETEANPLHFRPQLLRKLIDADAATFEADHDLTAEVNERIRQTTNEADEAFATVVRMSTLDGAVLISRNFEALAFGAKLRATKRPPLEVPIAGTKEMFSLGSKGTRHLSACGWVHSGKNRMALVVSQDQRARVFARYESGTVAMWEFRPRLFA